MIVFENNDLLILNKSCAIHTARGKSGGTLVDQAIEICPGLIKLSDLEFGLIHRLDYLTSGLVAFAKNRKTYEQLKDLWKKRIVRKIYRTVVCQQSLSSQIPKEITILLGNSKKSTKRMIAITNPVREKQIRGTPIPAETKILSKTRLSQEKWDIEIELITGVRHQIRCHLSSIGFPILGDPIYSKSHSERLWLHAWKLEVPLETKHFLFEAPLPENWPKF